MKTLDVSAMIVLYNLVIGILIMLSSEKVAILAGNISRSRGQSITRLTQLSTFTFGATVAVLSGSIYLLFHVLRIGV